MTISSATVHVDLPGRAYDVRIGVGLLAEAGAAIAPLGGRKHLAIVTDETVAGLHLAALQDGLAEAGFTTAALALPAGEGTKGWIKKSSAVMS